ncbi:MAG: transcriptional repressor [Mucinivorans sp.]
MDKVKELFRENGLKATAQRVIVYQALEKIGHASVDKVVEQVASVMPTITVATVYKILESLSGAGLISKMHTEQGKLFYDKTPTLHHHIYSSNDNSIRDFIDPELTSIIIDHLAEKSIDGFELEDISLQLIGKFTKEQN